jgi:hypothetical protein
VKIGIERREKDGFLAELHGLGMFKLLHVLAMECLDVNNICGFPLLP